MKTKFSGQLPTVMKSHHLRWRPAATLCLFLVQNTLAVLPSLILAVEDNASDETKPIMLLSHAMFGRIPSMDRTAEPILTVQYSDSLLCNDDDILPTMSKSDDGSGVLLMVPRGVCTFQTKAEKAQAAGAAAMIIYGTMASRYSVNASLVNPTIQDIVFPKDKMDYDCSLGHQSQIPSALASKLVFDDPIPYNAEVNDKIMKNSCGCEFCLATGLPNADNGTVHSCCAWDLSIYLYADATTNVSITIPAAYMTMEQETHMRAGQKVVLYQRWRPQWNISSILIWFLGVFVAALSGYVSAGEYHRKTKKLVERRNRNGPRSSQSSSPRRPPSTPLVSPEEVMELTAAHAAGFVVMSSTSLLVLFYFKIYGVVKVFYAFGCSTAMAQVICYPVSYWCLKRNVPIITSHPDIGDVTLRDVLCYAVSLSLGMTWLVLSFWHPNPDSLLFYWVMQDVFGACMCITFLQVIRLNNIRVASILLVVAFLYDIFFVFITPYLFHGKSVMITVATSGGPPKADELWCEKYPADADCQGGNPLPMLLTIPRLLDYTGGSSLLGLGDIVLPGLLLSFAARLDAAKSLVGVSTGGQAQAGLCPENRRNNYFLPIVIAYAVGLAMANLAVYLMHMGQPALLYLVPCCLGTMLVVGRNELHQLWDGPRVLKAADDILYGSSSSGGSEQLHAPLPVEEEASPGAILPPSAVDGDCDRDTNNNEYDK